MAIDKRLKIYDGQGNEVDYDILATDVKFSDGKDLPTKLDELEDEIGEGGYTPPQGGIPKTDLSSDVQTSLDKADTAYQKPASGIPATDIADGVIPDVSGLATKTEVNTGLADKVDKVAGKGLSSNDYTTADKNKLAGIAEGATANVGTVTAVKINGGNPVQPANGIVDLGNVVGQKGDKGDTGNVEFEDLEDLVALLVNDLTTGGAGNFLSAEMGKRLRQKIDEVYQRIQSIYVLLSNIAFWDDKPNINTVLPDLDWGAPKHTVILDLSLSHAVVKYNGIAKADGSTMLVAEGETLTLTVEADNGYAISSVASQVGTVVGNEVSLVMGGSNVTLDIEVETAADYVTDGLVAFFDGLDKGSTANAWTDKVGGKVFTNDGATSIAKGWSFNGVGGLYNNDALNWPASGYTIEVCFKSNAASTTRTLFHQKTNDGIGLGLYPHSGGGATKNSLTIYCTGTSGNKKSYIDSAAASAFIGTISANVERMLINANAATGDNDNTLGQGVLNTIGGRWDSSGGSNAWRHVLSGEIYAIRIYSRKLSEAEMLQNINADNVVYELGLTLNT